jgi:nitrate/nitrite-specific signal transduction histidine kinase
MKKSGDKMSKIEDLVYKCRTLNKEINEKTKELEQANDELLTLLNNEQIVDLPEELKILL